MAEPAKNASDDEFERQMQVAREIMDEDRVVLRSLAGREDAVPAEEVQEARKDLRRFQDERPDLSR